MPLRKPSVPGPVLEQTPATPPPVASLSYYDFEQDKLSDDDAGSPDGSPTCVAPLSRFSDVRIRVIPPPASESFGSNNSHIQDAEPADVEDSSDQVSKDRKSSPNVLDADALPEVHRSRTPTPPPEETSLSNDHLNDSANSSLEDLQLVQSQHDEKLQEALAALSLTRALLALERPGDDEDELGGSSQSRQD